MATLERLLEQKAELEERLADGDVKAEAALDRIDRAIMERKKTIAHSQKRLEAVKKAVAAGVPVEEARSTKHKRKPAAPKDMSKNRFE